MIESMVLSRRGQRVRDVSKGDLKERALLDSAHRLVSQGRFDGASIAEIADEAGISRASFYFYFASKQALLARMVDEAVSSFTARIVAVAEAAEQLRPAAAVTATVEAAAGLWWDHADVLTAGVALGATQRDVYARLRENFAVVREPTVALLQRFGTVPEAADAEAAAELVTALTFMSERTLFDLMRGDPTPAQRARVVARLSVIWLRAFGIPEDD